MSASYSKSISDAVPPIIRPLANAFFSLVSPLPARASLLRAYNAVANAGNVTVGVRPTDPTPLTFYCKVGDTQAGVQPPASIAAAAWAGSTQMFRLGPIFQAQNVPVTGVPPAASGTSKWCGIGAYRANGDLAAPEVLPFIAVPQQSTAMVNAKSCLFFTYADAGAALPHAPKEKFPDCRPYTAPVPIDSACVRISVQPVAGVPQQWTDCMGVPVDVDGKDNDNDLTDVVYSNGSISLLRSSRITPLDNVADPVGTWEGLLAGMWDFGVDGAGNPKEATKVLAIGPGLKNGAEVLLTVPTGTALVVENLQLGSHQERNWGDKADGTLNVTLVWS